MVMVIKFITISHSGMYIMFSECRFIGIARIIVPCFVILIDVRSGIGARPCASAPALGGTATTTVASRPAGASVSGALRLLMGPAPALPTAVGEPAALFRFGASRLFVPMEARSSPCAPRIAALPARSCTCGPFLKF